MSGTTGAYAPTGEPGFQARSPQFEIRLDAQQQAWRPVDIHALLRVWDPHRSEWVKTHLVDERPVYARNEQDGLLEFTTKATSDPDLATWETKLATGLLGRQDFYELVQDPIDLHIRAHPDRHIAGVPDLLDKRCRVVVVKPEGDLHWTWVAYTTDPRFELARGTDTPIRLEADGIQQVELDVQLMRWVPDFQGVAIDNRVFFSHNLPAELAQDEAVRRILPTVFGPYEHDLPWDQEGNKRTHSVWRSWGPLPPPPGRPTSGEVGFAYPGRIRVRVWLDYVRRRPPVDPRSNVDGYPLGIGLVFPEWPLVTTGHIPVEVVAPDIGVVLLNPDLPIPADGRQRMLDLEAMHARDLTLDRPSTLRMGYLQWDIAPGEWPTGNAEPLAVDLAQAEKTGHFRTEYESPERGYRINQTYLDDLRFYRVGLGQRRDDPPLHLHLNPSLDADITADKPGLLFGSPPPATDDAPKQPLRLHRDAGSTPQWVKGPIRDMKVDATDDLLDAHRRRGTLCRNAEFVQIHHAKVGIELPLGDGLTETVPPERISLEGPEITWELPELADGWDNGKKPGAVSRFTDDERIDVRLNKLFARTLATYEGTARRYRGTDTDAIKNGLFRYFRAGPVAAAVDLGRRDLELELLDHRLAMCRNLGLVKPEHAQDVLNAVNMLECSLRRTARVDEAVAMLAEGCLESFSEIISGMIDLFIALVVKIPDQIEKLLKDKFDTSRQVIVDRIRRQCQEAAEMLEGWFKAFRKIIYETAEDIAKFAWQHGITPPLTPIADKIDRWITERVPKTAEEIYQELKDYVSPMSAAAFDAVGHVQSEAALPTFEGTPGFGPYTARTEELYNQALAHKNLLLSRSTDFDMFDVLAAAATVLTLFVALAAMPVMWPILEAVLPVIGELVAGMTVLKITEYVGLLFEGLKLAWEISDQYVVATKEVLVP